jgi:hypothetical protein
MSRGATRPNGTPCLACDTVPLTLSRTRAWAGTWSGEAARRPAWFHAHNRKPEVAGPDTGARSHANQESGPRQGNATAILELFAQRSGAR